MNDKILSPFKRNDFTWKGKQEEENKSLKERFKLALQCLKGRIRFEYDPDDVDLEEVD